MPETEAEKQAREAAEKTAQRELAKALKDARRRS
jgi:hypothetical protein